MLNCMLKDMQNKYFIPKKLAMSLQYGLQDFVLECHKNVNI